MAIDVITIDTVIVGPSGDATGPDEFLCGYEHVLNYNIDVETAPNSKIDFLVGYFTIPVDPTANVGLVKVNDRTVQLSCESDSDIGFRTGYRIVAVVES
jgi:hypothetical protein